MKYNFAKIENKWQEKWLREKTYEPDLDSAARPFYNLMMFPYPSGEGLHVGHAFAFTGADVYGRKKRMEGCDVFQPIGYDSFGIHSENYAIKINEHPAKLTKKTTDRYEIQLKSLGIGYAWDEKLLTSDPEYYRWTQWIFIQLFKAGLAYRKKQAVNWCPKCLTVLADEQVVGGECERCSTVVIKKELEQWFFKITKYADRLLDGLDYIDWSEKIKIAQRNWIGKSEGASLKFEIRPARRQGGNSKHKIEVFTTRPDTLFGATYLVLAPDHELIDLLKSQIQNWDEVEIYRRRPTSTILDVGRLGEEKTGVELNGVYAINPANKEKIPVWVADYVLSGYGTGAIMAVPAHDERDFEFAKRFDLPIKKVVVEEFGLKRPNEKFKNGGAGVVFDPKAQKYAVARWNDDGRVTLFAGGANENESVQEAIIREVKEESGLYDFKKIEWIDVVYAHFFNKAKNVNRFARVECLLFILGSTDRKPVQLENHENFELVWLSADEILAEWEKRNSEEDYSHYMNFLRRGVALAGELGYDTTTDRNKYHTQLFTGRGIIDSSDGFSGTDSELAKWEITKFVGGERKNQYRLRDWLISRQRYWGPPIPMIWCDRCTKWMPERDENLPVLLPDVKDFRPTGTDKSPLANFPEFYETKCPECKGAARRETDVSDTFLDSAWYYFGYLAKENSKLEIRNPKSKARTRRWLPVNMYIGGAEHAVLHLLYVRFLSMALHDLRILDFSKDGEPIIHFRAHGLLIKDGAKMSKSKGNVVNPDEYIKVYGADAFRTYLMFLGPFQDGGDFRDTGIRGMTRFLNRVWNYFEQDLGANDIPEGLLRVTHKSIKKVSEDIEALSYNTALSTLMVFLTEMEKMPNKKAGEIFLKLLAPFAPYVTEELWEALGNKTSIHKSPWPMYDPAFLKESKFVLVLQINGKVRDSVEVLSGISEAEATELALARPKIQTFLAGAKPKKIIFVPKRLVNIVVGN